MTRWIIKTARGKLDLGAVGVVWKRFAKYAKPHRTSLLLAVCASFGAIFAQLASPWPIKIIFDYVLFDSKKFSWLGHILSTYTSEATTVLALCCGAILLVAIGEAVFSHMRDVTLATVGQKVVGTLRRDLFSHIQTLSPSILERRRTGDLLMRLTGDIQMLRQMLVNSGVTTAQSALTIIAMVAALFWLNPTLALLGIATIPITLLASWRISRQIRRATKEQREKESNVASIAHDVLGAMSIVQAFNREPIEQKRFSRNNRSSIRAGVKTTRLQSKLFRIVAIASAVATCAILYVGVRFVLKGVMTAGDLLVFIAYLRALNKPMRRLAKITSQLAKATSCGERIAEVFEIEPIVCDAETAGVLVDVKGGLEFQGVSFQYDDGTQALSDISLRVEPGQRVAVVGHTGAGKSTLIKLLLRFFDPPQGRLLIDGRDIREVTLSSLRDHIGWVHQDTILFGMSVAENIALACPDAKIKAIRTVARRVGAHKFIQALPDGYDTVLGQGGATLSGGQRQLLALARAILPGPEILLMDEPATGLDTVSHQKAEGVWMSQDNQATTLVICHHPKQMNRFDRIFVLEKGKICEQGTHNQLLKQGAVYASLFGGRPESNWPESSGAVLRC